MKYLKTAIILIALYTKFFVAASTCLPLTTDSSLCANPPGTISSDGFDDVCNLVGCCNEGNTPAVGLPSGSSITCSIVNCTSVCDLSNMRSNLGIEACTNTCTGRVCMFNAPSGAIGFGHVGWAYQVVGTTNWVYGSTEDISGSPFVLPGDPASTTSWSDTSDFTGAKNKFKNILRMHGQLYHNQGYYTQYRCKNVTTADVEAANSEVQLVLHSGYFIQTDNCLTKSIAVFNAYAPSLGLQAGYFIAVLPIDTLLVPVDVPLAPNFYYETLLPLYGFESSQQL